MAEISTLLDKEEDTMKNKLFKGILAFLIFALLSICVGSAIWLIAKFIVMISPIACAVIVMIFLLGWAVCREMDDKGIK